MKAEKLFAAMGDIEDDFIQEADTETIRIIGATDRKIWMINRKPWLINRWLWAAVIACLFVTLAGSFVINETSIKSDQYAHLPILSLTSADSDAYGGWGYFAYDVNELADGNPWTKAMKIETLPVFQRQIEYDGAGVPSQGLTAAVMKDAIQIMADKMNLTVDTIEVKTFKNGNDESEPISVSAQCGDITIVATTDGAIDIYFNKGVSIPEEYQFGNPSITNQQAEAGINYLVDQFAYLLPLTSPTISLLCDYNIYGEKDLTYTVFEGDGDITQQILNYNFNQITFEPALEKENVLAKIHMANTDLSEKIGDYPLMSYKKAQRLLIKGNYLSDGSQFPGKKYIKAVELVYRNGLSDQILMPYYQFYVELPEEEFENGLKAYSHFYVPAIPGKYIN